MMKHFYILPLAIILAACAGSSVRVVSVADGDTMTVMRDGEQIKLRIGEIDAPEKVQAYGDDSKHSLSDLCSEKPVSFEEKGKDRYGRTIARVFCGGVDVSAEQVRRGMAWVYDKYVSDYNLYVIQDEAKNEGRGLWADPTPKRPWEWRRETRSNKQ